MEDVADPHVGFQQALRGEVLAEESRGDLRAAHTEVRVVLEGIEVDGLFGAAVVALVDLDVADESQAR